MSEPPPPDLMDQGGRMRRIVLALILSGAAAAAVYGVAYRLADPDHQVTTGGFKFVFYVTGFVGIAAFITTLKVANWRADKKYRESLLAQARQVK